jgi:hypothetical protein
MSPFHWDAFGARPIRNRPMGYRRHLNIRTLRMIRNIIVGALFLTVAGWVALLIVRHP